WPPRPPRPGWPRWRRCAMSERPPRRSLWSVLWRGFGGNVRFAMGALLEHKLRSSLTILGIVVGVTTVMVMVAIVTGFNNNVIGNLQAFGANRIEIQKYEDRFGPGGPRDDEERRRKNITVDDALALRQALPEATVSSLIGHTDEVVHVKHGSLEANEIGKASCRERVY